MLAVAGVMVVVVERMMGEVVVVMLVMMLASWAMNLLNQGFHSLVWTYHSLVWAYHHDLSKTVFEASSAFLLCLNLEKLEGVHCQFCHETYYFVRNPC